VSTSSAGQSGAGEAIVTELEGLSREQRWRLILGKEAERALGGGAAGAAGALGSENLKALDATLGALYDAPEEEAADAGERGAGLGKSSPRIARWLGDVRKYFPREVVVVVQKDAIERRGLKQLLFEPELLAQVEPSVELVATLLTLKELIPDRAKESARALVKQVADEIVRRLRSGVERSIRGALNRAQHSPQPRLANLDVRRTLRHNLRNFDLEKKRLIVDRTFFFARRHKQREWTIILCLDQSGSMASSLVYGAVTASILASLPSVRTHLVAFDTEVVDLTERAHDPVDVLFGVQLGGGTDINRAVGYCQELIQEPRKTLFVLVSDLYEGGNQTQLLQRLEFMTRSGVRCAALLALDDGGTPAFDAAMARRVRDLDIPAFACTPNRLPDLLEDLLKGNRPRG
jgi:Mg-chelatase subunit ChlD